MSLLSIVQNAANELGAPAPIDVVSSTDDTTKQLYALANREISRLRKRTHWECMIREVEHISLASELQGVITTIAPGFDYIINDTIYDRTDQEKINGPMSATDWQIFKSSSISGPYQDYRIREGNLYFYPQIEAGHTIYFEYASRFAVVENDGVTHKEKFTLNTDTSCLDEDLITEGVIWRFLRAKGLDYAEEMRTYEIDVNDAISRNGGKRTLSMSEEGMPRPSIAVPEGSWNV